MTKTIDKETFVYDILQKSKYAFVNQFEGLYKVRDDYTNRNYEDGCYALVNFEDDKDVIVLADYLDSPECTITYDDSYGIPTFLIEAGRAFDEIDLAFVQFVRPSQR